METQTPEGLPGFVPEGFFVASFEESQPKFDKKASTSTKVRHVEVGFFSVSDAALKLGKNPRTIERWCESGKLAATPKPYGTRITWLISAQAIELTLMMEAVKGESRVSTKQAAQQNKPHAEFQKAWVTAMAKGTLNGKVYSPRTIDDYSHYVEVYFTKHQMVTLESLKRDLNAIPTNQFSKREHYYKAVLCFSRFLILENLLDKSFLEAIAPLCPKRHLPPKRQTVSESELQTLLANCEIFQDKLIITLLSQTGLRASEACKLVWEDIELEAGWLIVRLGKGNKTRKVGLTGRLTEMLELHRANSIKRPNYPVLTNRSGKPMDRNGLYQRLERLGTKTGVKVSPHALRRAFVTINANKGRPLPILQRSCGHSDVRTTMSYCLTSEQEVIAAMKGWD